MAPCFSAQASIVGDVGCCSDRSGFICLPRLSRSSLIVRAFDRSQDSCNDILLKKELADPVDIKPFFGLVGVLIALLRQ